MRLAGEGFIGNVGPAHLRNLVDRISHRLIRAMLIQKFGIGLIRQRRKLDQRALYRGAGLDPGDDAGGFDRGFPVPMACATAAEKSPDAVRIPDEIELASPV